MNNKLSFLISTKGSGIKKIKLPELHDDVAYVIVHQDYNACNESEFFSILERSDVTYIKDEGLGLTRSRNIAIKNARSDYCYILDDDVTIIEGAINKIMYIIDNHKFGLAAFRVEVDGGNFFKKYKNKIVKINMISAARVCSIEILFNRNIINDKKVIFNERFGLGTNLPSGEEYIFITNCLKKGIECLAFPISTVIHPIESSGDDFFTDKAKVVAKKEMFKEITGVQYSLLWGAFLVKKIPDLLKKRKFRQFIRWYL
ncbi:glycosyltransferase [Photobacterium carnosum]|uniref:glycosyltransferase family 2 protein n=1 Tax=Photobacterium carnosum TaxID=2023717 RepID=UPI001E416020|nr:glycosyltransferase [Photobacterium carnosum]MCD9522779.1 glycosyltransferase [Photobacterium carnosum]